jgi:small ligand-binding sensory domain FIST
LNADLLLNVVQYLCARDGCRLAATASRYFYLVHHYRQLRGAELVAATSYIPQVKSRQQTPRDVYEQALSKLQSKPNLCLAFNKPSGPLADHLPLLVPDDCVILGAISSSIQSSFTGQLEYKSNSSIMLGSMKDAQIRPFCLQQHEQSGDYQGTLDQLDSANCSWKVFMVYACGDLAADVEPFVTHLQNRYPNSTIVGGICNSGYISVPIQQKTKSELTSMPFHSLLHLNQRLGGRTPDEGITKVELVHHVHGVMQTKRFQLKVMEDEGGVFGVALAGDVPVRSMVSRGVTSLTYRGAPLPTTPFYADVVEFHRPGDEEYMFQGEDPPSYHLIRRVRDTDSGKTYSAHEMMMKFGSPNLIGIRRPNEDGFELHIAANDISRSLNAFLFMVRGSPDTEKALTDANIDFFDIDGAACMQDMEVSIRHLKEQTHGEQLLGAVMFSCSARGPTAGNLLSVDMADATSFANGFPNVPCLGFYAGGEIGPVARAGRQDVFRSGNATLQGFTAVFALFIVPEIDLGTMILDDRRENVEAFLRGRLATGIHDI